MASGRGGGVEGASAAVDGKKRKQQAADDEANRREPRRGMGVAELERIRLEIEMAETCVYAIVPSSALSPVPAVAVLHHFPPPLAPPCFVPSGAAMAHHQCVGNGPVQVEYFTPCYRAPQHYADGSLPRLLTSDGPAPPPHQNNHVDQQIQSAVTTAHPALETAAASSASSSSAYQLHHRRRQIQPTPQFGQARNVAFVDLVDSDDDNDGGALVEELDLELKL